MSKKRGNAGCLELWRFWVAFTDHKSSSAFDLMYMLCFNRYIYAWLWPDKA
jgi:hypothetical protein